MLDLATGGIDDVRVTDHDVILARKDLPPGYLRLSNPAQGNFQASLVIPSIGLEIKRGWCSVDAFVRGRTFRFINMHLEEESFPTSNGSRPRRFWRDRRMFVCRSSLSGTATRMGTARMAHGLTMVCSARVSRIPGTWCIRASRA